MARKRHTAEDIINKLREAEVGLARGMAVPEVCRKLGVSEQTYYRWRKENGHHANYGRSAKCSRRSHHTPLRPTRTAAPVMPEKNQGQRKPREDSGSRTSRPRSSVLSEYPPTGLGVNDGSEVVPLAGVSVGLAVGVDDIPAPLHVTVALLSTGSNVTWLPPLPIREK